MIPASDVRPGYGLLPQKSYPAHAINEECHTNSHFNQLHAAVQPLICTILKNDRKLNPEWPADSCRLPCVNKGVSVQQDPSIRIETYRNISMLVANDIPNRHVAIVTLRLSTRNPTTHFGKIVSFSMPSVARV